MNPRTALVVLAAVLISILAIVIGWKVGQRQRATPAADEVLAPPVETPEGEVVEVELFFPGPGGRLSAEAREIEVEEEIESHLTRILEQLLAGPRSAALYPALPAEMTLGWVHLGPRGIAYVDVEVTGEAAFPGWGSKHELLAAYSIVNTLLANVPELEAVVLLRNGQQQTTFAGHLDTTRPLVANRSLLVN
jgi:hypothetical protein